MALFEVDKALSEIYNQVPYNQEDLLSPEISL